MVFSHSKLRGVIWEPGTAIIAHQSDLFTVTTCYHGDCSEKLPSVHKYLWFSRANHLPAFIETITGHKSKGRAPLGKPYSLTLLLALLSSLISSTIRTFCPILPPDCPSVEVGPSRFPCGSRGSLQPMYFHRLPRLSYIYGKVIPAHASPARSPLVAVPDHFNGVVPS